MKPENFRVMRITVATLFYSVCTVLNAWADEKLPVLRAGAEVYSNVTVTAVTATDVYFTYNKGVANVKLKSLDPALQKHFQFDAASAGAANTGKTGGDATTAPSATSGADQVIDRKNAQAIMDDAIARVKGIVNQPVRQLARTPELAVSTYSPGWFHPGAAKPDFKAVDVRASQDIQYERRPYVTSDMNPGVAFVGSEVEFNPMTKYFYVDRSLPKKRLTETEMLEINRLYRIIGRCEDKLQPPSALVAGFLSGHKNVVFVAAGLLVLLLLSIRVLRARQVE